MATFQQMFPHLFDPTYVIPNFLNLFMAALICCFLLWFVENKLDEAGDWFMKIHGKNPDGTPLEKKNAN